MILLLWDSHGTFSIDAAMLWMLLSAASWAGYNIMTRKLVAMGYTSAQITCFSMLGAALWPLLFYYAGLSGDGNRGAEAFSRLAVSRNHL